MWASGDGHQSAVDVGRRRYSLVCQLCPMNMAVGIVWVVAYISVVDDDEGVGRVSCGYQSNAHVVYAPASASASVLYLCLCTLTLAVSSLSLSLSVYLCPSVVCGCMQVLSGCLHVSLHFPQYPAFCSLLPLTVFSIPLIFSLLSLSSVMSSVMPSSCQVVSSSLLVKSRSARFIPPPATLSLA